MEEVNNKEIPKNKSLTFLVPLLGIGKFAENAVLNSFLSYDSKLNKYQELNNVIYLEFEKQLYILDKHKLFKGSFPSDRDTVIYILEYTPLIEENLQVFMDGKYSQFTDKAKFIISAQYPNLIEVFNKSIKRRKALEEFLNVELPEDAELFPILNLDNEIYIENSEEGESEKGESIFKERRTAKISKI